MGKQRCKRLKRGTCLWTGSWLLYRSGQTWHQTRGTKRGVCVSGPARSQRSASSASSARAARAASSARAAPASGTALRLRDLYSVYQQPRGPWAKARDGADWVFSPATGEIHAAHTWAHTYVLDLYILFLYASLPQQPCFYQATRFRSPHNEMESDSHTEIKRKCIKEEWSFGSLPHKKFGKQLLGQEIWKFLQQHKTWTTQNQKIISDRREKIK